jgi:multidrug resistance efflux pump
MYEHHMHQTKKTIYKCPAKAQGPRQSMDKAACATSKLSAQSCSCAGDSWELCKQDTGRSLEVARHSSAPSQNVHQAHTAADAQRKACTPAHMDEVRTCPGEPWGCESASIVWQVCLEHGRLARHPDPLC